MAEHVMPEMRGRHNRLIGILTPEERDALTVGLTALTRATSEEFGLD